jgi:hypothetical protein
MSGLISTIGAKTGFFGEWALAAPVPADGRIS